jgi:hypothetical protein
VLIQQLRLVDLDISIPGKLCVLCPSTPRQAIAVAGKANWRNAVVVANTMNSVRVAPPSSSTVAGWQSRPLEKSLRSSDFDRRSVEIRDAR